MIAVSAAARLRNLLSSVLHLYEKNHGISGDAYCKIPQWHAFAEAQYLEAIAICHSAGLLSGSEASKRASAAVARLRDGALHREPGVFAQWGLGFGWQDFSADQPFVITTALVTRALIAAQGLTKSTDLACEGLAGLERMPRVEIMGKEAFSVPISYPSCDDIVDNCIAVWAQVVLAVDNHLSPGLVVKRDAMQALHWLNSRFVPKLGWVYSATRPTLDLVHQAFILEALQCCRAWSEVDMEEHAIEVFAGFRAGEGYIDIMKLVNRNTAIELAERSTCSYLSFRGDHILSVSSNPARLWSLGSMLGSFGLFAMTGTRSLYWKMQIRGFPISMIPKDLGIDFRQEMALARGLALALYALRG